MPREPYSLTLLLALFLSLTLCSCGGPIYLIISSSHKDDDDSKAEPAAILVPQDYPTIQAAIDAAGHGDIVLVADGTYKGPGNKDLDFAGKAIHLKSAGGAKNCIIDCENSGRGFYFHSGETNAAIVRGFTIQNGDTGSGHGAGIYCYNYSDPTIADCIITNNRTTAGSGGYGGGIYCEGSPKVVNCVIANNTADCGGGIGCYDVHPTLINCTIANNNTGGDGGGIYCHESDVILNNTIIWGNSAAGSGNQVYTEDVTATVTLNYCDYADGPGDVQGTGSFTTPSSISSDPLFINAAARNYHLSDASPCIDTGYDLYVTWSSDLDGRRRILGPDVDIGAYEGGWLLVPSTYGTIQDAIDASADNDTILVADGTYTGVGNRDLDFDGKAITVKSAGGASACVIDCQNAGRGFHFYSGESARAVVEGFTIRNGSADRGAAIGCFNYSCPTITSCIMDSNSAAFDGGGIFCASSDVTITSCTFTNNSANWGGGICYHGADPLISNCVIASNNATGQYGGGICADHDSASIITNCLIINNSSAVGGGGLYTNNNSCPTLANCTIADNSAGSDGGAVYAGIATVTICNSIIWGNTAAGAGNQFYTDGTATTITLEYCDYANAANDIAGIGFLSPDSCFSVDPLFVTGPGGDYYLSQLLAGQGSDSPCLDAGNDTAACLSLDTKTTRTDTVVDAGTVDIGYHYDP